MTLDKLVKKIKRELKDVDKIVDYNPVLKSELLMVSHKGKLYKKFQYENKEKGSYTGFERYFANKDIYKINWYRKASLMQKFDTKKFIDLMCKRKPEVSDLNLAISMVIEDQTYKEYHT